MHSPRFLAKIIATVCALFGWITRLGGNQRERAVFFIDGFNLYRGICSLGDSSLKWLNLEQLAQNIAKTNNREVVKIYYFTSFVSAPVHDSQKPIRQKQYFRALEKACPLVNIILGKFERPRYRCYQCREENRAFNCAFCGAENKGYKERRTDVNIACQMVAGAHTGEFDTAYLISGDTDLLQAIKMTRDQGKRVVAVFPPNRYTDEIATATNSVPVRLTLAMLDAARLPDHIPTNKKPITIPHKWKNP